jgi:uncharacterized membrane protein YsdA (DUF1294 family)
MLNILNIDFASTPFLILLAYIAIISLISVIVCCYDKIAAKKFTKHRTREATLLWLSVLGGSVAMLLTMFAIRHKTKHAKFMVGIPLIIIAQIAIAALILFLL